MNHYRQLFSLPVSYVFRQDNDKSQSKLDRDCNSDNLYRQSASILEEDNVKLVEGGDWG